MIFSDIIYSRLQKYVFLCFILFALLHLSLRLLFPNDLPEGGIIFVQIVFYCSFLFGFTVGWRLKIKSLFVFVFGYQLVLSVFLYLYFCYFVGNPLGYDPIDALLYKDIAELTMDMDWECFVHHLKYYSNIDISDYGFPFIQRLVFMLLGSRWGIEGMIGLNILFHLITLWYLYKLSLLLLDDKREVRLVVLLWGISICSVWLNVSGLKEQAFVFLVVAATYYMYMFNLKHQIGHLLLFFCFTFSIWFFRYYVSLFLLIVFLFFCVFQKVYNKLFLLYCLGIIVIIVFGINILVYFMPELEVIKAVREKVANDNGQGALMYHAVSFIFAFLGPIPSFLETPKKMNLLIAVYSIGKMILSIFGVYAAFWIMKIQKTRFYPLVNLVLFNTLLTIVSGYALSYRYVYITMPLYLILMVYGVKLLVNRKVVLALYIGFCLLSSLFFNMRNF